MTPNGLAKEVLKSIGVYEPTKADIMRVARRLHIDKITIGKRILIMALLKGANVFIGRDEPDKEGEV